LHLDNDAYKILVEQTARALVAGSRTGALQADGVSEQRVANPGLLEEYRPLLVASEFVFISSNQVS
jgi:hypothetical protein